MLLTSRKGIFLGDFSESTPLRGGVILSNNKHPCLRERAEMEEFKVIAIFFKEDLLKNQKKRGIQSSSLSQLSLKLFQPKRPNVLCYVLDLIRYSKTYQYFNKKYYPLLKSL